MQSRLHLAAGGRPLAPQPCLPPCCTHQPAVRLIQAVSDILLRRHFVSAFPVACQCSSSDNGVQAAAAAAPSSSSTPARTASPPQTSFEVARIKRPAKPAAAGSAPKRARPSPPVTATQPPQSPSLQLAAFRGRQEAAASGAPAVSEAVESAAGTVLASAAAVTVTAAVTEAAGATTAPATAAAARVEDDPRRRWLSPRFVAAEAAAKSAAAMPLDDYVVDPRVAPGQEATASLTRPLGVDYGTVWTGIALRKGDANYPVEVG